MRPSSNELLRRVLRSIALGVPLVLGPLVVGCDENRCPVSRLALSVHPLTPALRASLEPGGVHDAALCAPVCRSLDFPSGDAGGADTGPSMVDCSFASSAVGCEYASGSELVCTYGTPAVCPSSSSGLCWTSTPGRAPQALLGETARAHGAAGWLADAARLEAASVPAFEELAEELSLHGAPAALVRGARRAAGDERRHADAVGRLARAYGAAPSSYRRGEHAPRSLSEVVIDNIAEGCVREALGALAAAHQGNAAGDARAAMTFRAIARDEARHALLSLAIDAWARPRPSRATRGAADDAREAALASVRRDASGEPEPAMRLLLGMPDATRASELAGWFSA